MDLRTKLVFALVAVALGSMATLGGFTYGSARSLLQATALEQLDGIAESKTESVDRLVSGWHERVQLIASRTQLRLTLRDYERSHGAAEAGRIHQILLDALRSTRTVESLAVFDSTGTLVAWVGDAADRADAATPAPPYATGPLSEYLGLRFGATGEPHLGFVANLTLDGGRIGTLRATLNAEELFSVIQNYQGLGETGETMVVVRDETGSVRVIHPVRHHDDAGPAPLRLDDPDDPAALALSGETARTVESAIDYRGHRVFAAQRFVPATGWGLVVKRDEDEMRAPIVEFRNQLTQLGITLAAFAILLGTTLGLGFAKPIRELAAVANRIRDGELSARAQETREDEIGVLARTFNSMAAELESRLVELREFHRYFDFSRDMLCIAGTDGYFKRTNPAFERVLGWTNEQLVSKPFYDLVHPDDVEATRREVARLAEGIPTIRFENRYRCADGAFRYLLWTAQPEPTTGLLYAAAREITNLKEAQSQMEARLRTLPLPMIGIRVDGTITTANPAAEGLLQQESGKLVDRPIGSILTGDDGKPFDGAAAQAATDRGQDAPHMCSASRADGSAIAVEVRLHPIRDAAETNNLLSMVDRTGIQQALQEIRALEQALVEARARLRADA